jgi:hypothetical protein
MKIFRTIWVAGAIYYYNYKTEFGQCLMIAACCRKRPAAYTPTLRARINIIYYRI